MVFGSEQQSGQVNMEETSKKEQTKETLVVCVLRFVIAARVVGNGGQSDFGRDLL